MVVDVSSRRGVSRRGFLTVAVSAIVAGVVAGVGAYYAGTLAAPVKEVVKEVTKTVTSTTTLAPGAPYTTTVTATAPPTTITKTVTTTVTATPTATLPPKEKVKIGCSLPLSGIFAAGCTIEIPPAIQMIVDDYNAKGGLYLPEYGRRVPVELIMYDCKSDVETLMRQYEKLIIEDKVDYIIGTWGTSLNFAIVPLAEKYRHPLIIFAGQSQQLASAVKAGDLKWIFLVLPQSHVLGKHVADYLVYMGAKNIGIIYINDLHGIENAGAIYSALYAKGIMPVIYESYPLGVMDLSPLIKKLKDANVDALVACSYPDDHVLLIRQSIALDFSPKIWIDGPGSILPPLTVDLFGPEVMKGISHYHGARCFRDSPKFMEFRERWYKYSGVYPPNGEMRQYAAYEMLFQAIEKYGLDREKVRDALAKETFETFMGKAKFLAGDYLDIEGQGFIGQWQGDVIDEVVWPLEVASAKPIVKPPWPK
jgi:branched-chain amino acid transport system substrate-binding protein